MKRLFSWVGVGGLLLAQISTGVWANDRALEVESGAFGQQKHAVLTELSTGEQYAAISDQDRQIVTSLLHRMQELVGVSGEVDSLSASERIQLFNDQEQVNAILTRARDDSRLVCRRETVVGSRLSQTVCLTVAERRLATERSQDLMRRNTSTQPLKSR